MSKKGKEADPDLIGQVYEYDEDELAKMIGLKRRFVQEAREAITSTRAWTLQHGAVIYSREGVAQLLKALGCACDAAELENLLKTSRVDGKWVNNREGYRLARVTLRPINRKIVLAMLMDHPERMTVRVMVGDNTTFIPGMEMNVRIVSEPDLYEMVGNKSSGRSNW